MVLSEFLLTVVLLFKCSLFIFLKVIFIMGFPDSSVGKESACNAGDPGSIPGLGWSPGEGIAYPLQYSGLENPRDCTAYAVTKSQTWLSDFHYLYRYTFICYPFPSLSSIYYFPAMHNVSLGVFSHLSPHSLHPVSVSNITWLGIKHIKYVYSIPRLPWWLRCKEFTCSEKDLISAPWLGRFPGVAHGNPLQYPCLENPMDRGGWWATRMQILTIVLH